MIDTGMNRLGLRPTEIDAARRADDRHAAQPSRLRRRGRSARTQMQLERFRAVAVGRAGQALQPRQSRRHLPRPRLQLRPRSARACRYTAAFRGPRRKATSARSRASRRRSSSGGRSRRAKAAAMARRSSPSEDTEAAILNIGYADGYLRGFSSRGSAFAGEFALPVLGRVSMDLIAVGCDAAPGLKEGDWVEIDYDLPSASKQSGLSQYELLTTLGHAVRAALDLAAPRAAASSACSGKGRSPGSASIRASAPCRCSGRAGSASDARRGGRAAGRSFRAWPRPRRRSCRARGRCGCRRGRRGCRPRRSPRRRRC